jgi:dihydroxyacid dehydratase/phosphogluconate dehydratase
MRRRGGRPGLIGTMARTAVITKTATTVAGNTQRRQMEQAQAAAATQAPPVQAAPAAPPPPASAPAGTGDLIDQLGKLADLKAAGVLDDAEFATAKARLLGA